jgi:HK97 family phage major capsid protein
MATATVLDDRVKELSDRIKDKRDAAQKKWAAFEALRDELAGSDTDAFDPKSDGFQKAHEAHREYGELADELVSLEEQRESLWAMTGERGKTDPRTPERQAREGIKDGLRSRESYGARVTASEAYKAIQAAGVAHSRSNLGKVQLGEMMTREEFVGFITNAWAVITGDDASGGALIPVAQPSFIAPRDRPLLLTDLVMVGTTDSDEIPYVVESGFTNNAAGVKEATSDAPIGDGTGGTVTAANSGRKPQSALTYEKKSESVKTLAHWIAQTRRILADAPRLASLIDGRLRYGLARVVDEQMVTGDGTGEDLQGVLNTPGIQHQDRTADPLVDDLLRALTKVRLAFFDPSAVGINPSDWVEDVRLTKDDNGNYIYGPPAYNGPETVWGVNVVQGAQFPTGNPVVGEWRTAELYIREGIQVLASDSHADFFVRNLIALLAEMRCGFVVPQPEAFCEVSAP